MTFEKLSPSMFIGVKGKDIISFGSGQPDLPPPKQVYDILPTYKDFKYGLTINIVSPEYILPGIRLFLRRKDSSILLRKKCNPLYLLLTKTRAGK